MLREVEAKDLAPGDIVALPFKKTATVKEVKVGRQFVTVSWVDPYMDSRYEIHQAVMLEGKE
jgi:hypothetical protein